MGQDMVCVKLVRMGRTKINIQSLSGIMSHIGSSLCKYLVSALSTKAYIEHLINRVSLMWRSQSSANIVLTENGIVQYQGLLQHYATCIRSFLIHVSKNMYTADFARLLKHIRIWNE